MTYPLLFPYGTDGWTINVRSLDGMKKISHLEWLRFHLMTRSGVDNFLHRARKLFQQYIVDEFERHQTMEMSYFVNNQQQLRADLYHGLQDAVKNNDFGKSGRVVIVPASYTCSDRWYRKKI